MWRGNSKGQEQALPSEWQARLRGKQERAWAVNRDQTVPGSQEAGCGESGGTGPPNRPNKVLGTERASWGQGREATVGGMSSGMASEWAWGTEGR